MQEVMIIDLKLRAHVDSVISGKACLVEGNYEYVEEKGDYYVLVGQWLNPVF